MNDGRELSVVYITCLKMQRCVDQNQGREADAEKSRAFEIGASCNGYEYIKAHLIFLFKIRNL